MTKYKMHVISHTHWDREWYYTFQQFRLRLVDLVDHLLEILDTDPEFKYFNLDGQTIVLEDYLAIRPQNEGKLRKYIQEGRILVGPWYQLNDENLVSGESTVRSLLIGHRIAADFGGVMKLGYLPDQFGNISQMPQIFRGFGIDGVIFGRGRQIASADDKMEAVWVSPDGSEVISSLMAHWYNNAQRFPNPTLAALAYTERIRNAMAPIAATPYLLLMNGVDHLEAQPDLGDILPRLSKVLKDDEIIHSTMPAYMDDVKHYIKTHNIALQRVQGELREDRGGSVLAGTLSSRMYLKQANNRSETWLERYAEPLSAFSMAVGGEYHADMLRYAWKLLMQNHPHDSICGCSLDQVHDEMMPRFLQVDQIADELSQRSLSCIASQINTEAESLVVFNTLAWTRTDKVVAQIDIRLGDLSRGTPEIDKSRDVHAFELFDSDGQSVPFKLLRNQVTARQITDPHELPMAVMVRAFEIEFIAAEVPSCGYKSYSIKPTRRWPVASQNAFAFSFEDNSISNGLLTIRPSHGGIAIYDESASSDDELFFDALGMIEDGGDVGDEYNYVNPLNDRLVLDSGEGTISLVDNSPASMSIVRDSVLKLPKTSNSQKRASETVDCAVRTTYTLAAGATRVDVVTTIENMAEDHRLRVVFPTGVASDVAYAEMPYDVVARSIHVPEDWHGASSFFPQRHWVDVNDGVRGLTIINKGLPEYEIYDLGTNSIALTLLRCVGKLSGTGDTPTAIPTPGAQCKGNNRFEYAIYPHAGTWQQAQVWRQAHAHNVPMASVQTAAHSGTLSASLSFIEVSETGMVVTAIKKAEDNGATVIRLFNILDEPVSNARVRLHGASKAALVDLNECHLHELAVDDGGWVSVDAGPKQIVSIAFE